MTRRPVAPHATGEVSVEIEAEPDSAIAFGRKNLWIAVSATSTESVARALGLVDTQPCNWRSGFRAAYAYPSSYVFVTPPVRGWVLAVGCGIPDPGDPSLLPHWRALMNTLSTAFGRAQFFASHRGSGYSAWARYTEGVEERLFAHADDLLHNVGTPLPEELDVLAHLPDPSAAEEDPGYWDREDLRAPDEDDVFRMASAWSVDPMTLDHAFQQPTAGVVGRNCAVPCSPRPTP